MASIEFVGGLSMIKRNIWHKRVLLAAAVPLAMACADLTELQQVREDRALELSSYLAEIASQQGATLQVSSVGKTTLSITQQGHPLRGVIFEVDAAALPPIAEGEKLFLELLPKSEIIVPVDGTTPAVVGTLADLPDQTVVGTVVNVALYKFPGRVQQEFVGGGNLTLPIEPCVPALLESFLGAATLAGTRAVLENVDVKFRNRHVVAKNVVSGTYAPVLGGGKVCGGLLTAQPPIAGGLQFTVDEDTVLNANLSVVTPRPDDIVYSMVTGTTYGTVTVNTNGAFTYVPDANFYGIDTFEFRGFDGYELSNTGVVVIFVINVNDAPVAYDLLVSTTTAAATTTTGAPGAVTATDIDHSVLHLHYRPINLGPDSSTSFGSVVMGQTNSLGQGPFTYRLNVTDVAAACVAGFDSFEFVASDLIDDSAPALVTIAFTDCPPPPP